MKLLFLGSGTSTGVPQIGCNCAVCKSDDKKDKRLRASVIVTDGDTQILIDCGPDFRHQAIRNNIKHLSGIILTHNHYDHIGGLDDVRPLGNANVYAEKVVLDTIKRNLAYCFGENKYPGVPSIILNQITEKKFNVNQTEIKPIRVMHARLPILGFRIGNIAYITDLKTIDESEIEHLKNLDVLVLNALRPEKHISHISLGEAIVLATKIDAKKTYFTHMSHDMGLHNEVNKILPKNMQLAYDGLEIEI